MFPLAARAEMRVRQRAEVAGVSLRRKNLVRHIAERVENSAVGIINENECRLGFHTNGAFFGLHTIAEEFRAKL